MVLNDSFWNNEKNRMLAILQPRLEQMAVEAAKQAAQKAGISFNPNLANANAARWARDYTDTLLKQLGTTSTTGIGEIIAQWVEKPGATYGQLQQSLIQYGNVRAQAIAVTETTRAYAEGEEMAYKQEGITEWTWMTNKDELVCPYCSGANNQTRKIGEKFGTFHGKDVTKPPFHPNCRCWCSPSVKPNKERDAVVKPASLPIMPTLAAIATLPAAGILSEPKLEPVTWKPTMARAEAERWASDSQVTEIVSHVTSAANIANIRKDGFDLTRSVAGRVWGNGVYLGLDNEAEQFYKDLYSKLGSVPEKINIKVNVKNVLKVDVSTVADRSQRYTFVANQIPNGENRYKEIVNEIEQNNKKVSSDADKLFPFPLDRSKKDEVIIAARKREEYKNKNYVVSVYTDAITRLLNENNYDALQLTDSAFHTWVGGNQLMILNPQNVTVIDDE